MPGRPSCSELQKQLLECRQVITDLSTDPDWNVTTQAAIPYALPPIQKLAAYVVYAAMTPEAPLFPTLHPGAVKRAVHTRSASCLLRARWDRENDVVFILSAHPLQFCRQLETAMRNEGLSALVGWSTYTGNLALDIEDCKRNAGLNFTLPQKGEQPYGTPK